MSNLNAVIAQLKQAREQAVREVNRLDAALSALGSLNGSFRGAQLRRTGRRISAAGRARIAAAQRARWARAKGNSGSSAKRTSHKMSASARKRIASAQRLRWAKWRRDQRAA